LGSTPGRGAAGAKADFGDSPRFFQGLPSQENSQIIPAARNARRVAGAVQRKPAGIRRKKHL
jgi:hypothetical protein